MAFGENIYRLNGSYRRISNIRRLKIKKNFWLNNVNDSKRDALHHNTIRRRFLPCNLTITLMIYNGISVPVERSRPQMPVDWAIIAVYYERRVKYNGKSLLILSTVSDYLVWFGDGNARRMNKFFHYIDNFIYFVYITLNETNSNPFSFVEISHWSPEQNFVINTVFMFITW